MMHVVRPFKAHGQVPRNFRQTGTACDGCTTVINGASGNRRTRWTTLFCQHNRPPYSVKNVIPCYISVNFILYLGRAVPVQKTPFPTPIYSTNLVREIEQRCERTLPPLMEQAGLAAAEIARELAPDNSAAILILAGPGNNGGDAFVVARHLLAGWHKVDVLFIGDANALPPDAKAAYYAWIANGGSCHSTLPPHGRWGLVIDGLFGIGLQRPLTGAYAELVDQINQRRLPTLALDIPSGLQADSGLAVGSVIRASHTVTFIGLKPGLLTNDGPDYCGQLLVRGLNLGVLPPLANGFLLQQPMVDKFLTPRPRNSHKALFGSVGIIGGADGMAGAALLAARAALKLGAGRVYVGLLDANAAAFDPQQAELMLRRIDNVFGIGHLSCLTIGPGLGQSPIALQCLARAIASKLPLVLDADALNLLAQDSTLQTQLSQRTAPSLITPHAAEAARLLGTDTEAVRRQRIHTAQTLASKLNCHVVLKGAGSICAAPSSPWYINSSGNPGLASAGTGDVLTGMISAFLAQDLNAHDALLLGVYLHGAAADTLVAQGIGPIGLTASEVIEAARRLLNQWVY